MKAIAFVLSLVAWTSIFGSVQGEGVDIFMSREEVVLSAGNQYARQAIVDSGRSLDEFVKAFNARSKSNSSFLVVACRRIEDSVKPFGIEVTSISGSVFRGRLIQNKLKMQIGSEISCNENQVVDWRYDDMMFLRGGALYRAYFTHQENAIRHRLESVLPFQMLVNNDFFDSDVGHLFKDIASDNVPSLRQRLEGNPELANIDVKMPTYGFGRGKAIVMGTFNAPGYAATFGSAECLTIMFKQGLVGGLNDQRFLLFQACHAGNVEAVRVCLEYEVDPNSLCEIPVPYLQKSVQNSHEDVVRALVDAGADINVRNHLGQTPIYFAESANIASFLIASNAEIETRDNYGESVLDFHLSQGNIETCNLLSNHCDGFRFESSSIEKNSTDSSASFDDFGFVLPVLSIEED